MYICTALKIALKSPNYSPCNMLTKTFFCVGLFCPSPYKFERKTLFMNT